MDHLIKNCTIETIAFGGFGIARVDGKTVFIPGGAPGDVVTIKIVKSKKTFAFGEIVEITKKSELREKPRCPYYGKCGGCQLQHIKYPEQIKIKHQFLQDSLQRIGQIKIDVDKTVGSSKPFLYRQQISLKLFPVNGKFQAVFSGVCPSEKINIESCSLFSESHAHFHTLNKLLEELPAQGISDANLKLFKDHKDKWIGSFSFYPKLPITQKEASFLTEKYPLFSALLLKAPRKSIRVGSPILQMEKNGIKFSYPPTCFSQNNPEISHQIYDLIVEELKETTRPILDLYCGIGISTLLLAKTGKKVHGVELSSEGVAAAKKSQKLNQIEGAHFHSSSVEDFLKKWDSECSVIVNPPREGLSNQVIDALKNLPIKKFIYISCNPATLARDLKALKITPRKAIPFDHFPQTTHLESVIIT